MNRLVLPLLLLGLPAFGQGTKQDDMKDCPMHAAYRTVTPSRGGKSWGSSDGVSA